MAEQQLDTGHTMMPANFDLSAAYLNERRIAELCDPADVRRVVASLDAINGGNLSPDTAVLRLVAYKDLLRRWLLQRPGFVRPLDEFLLAGTSPVGRYIRLYHNFYGDGIASPANAADHAPEIYTTIDTDGGSLKVRAPLLPTYIAPGTAALRLRSRARLTVIGFAEQHEDGVLQLRCIFAGDIVPAEEDVAFIAGPHFWWDEHEISVEEIDSFSKVRGVARPGAAGIRRLATVPEEKVKQALCEILAEPDVPRDWGGEQSDLFSSHLVVRGKRVSAAFLLKGPAKHSPMKFAHLGKNGDQIVRMFELPAQVFVLQHCHRVTPAIRTTMQRFAVWPGSPSRYCVIDGEDTYRLLAAYGKCSLGDSPRRRPVRRARRAERVD